MRTETCMPADMKDLNEVLSYALYDIRYASDHNFAGTVIDGYEEAAALLCGPAALALKAAEEELKEKGYLLKIWDAFRPGRAVAHFMRWAEDPADVRNKAVYYPHIDKKDLIPLGYIAARSSHSRASTVDLTLVRADTLAELDMGGMFDSFMPSSASDYTDLTAEQLANRSLLKETMMRHGFVPLAEEWWHFTLKDEPYPDTYFDFPVRHISL
ncbi:MAG: M15 family metallopeptidase [Solobacterium sp.]|nr:M15 family metallopeptidase [Solobacterium sp.]